MKTHLQRWWLFYFFYALIVGSFVAGCESLPKPQGFEQRLAYAYGTYTAVVDTAATQVEAGRLSAQDGAKVLELSDQARSFLDLSRVAYELHDEILARERLDLAIVVLSELQRYLEARSKR